MSTETPEIDPIDELLIAEGVLSEEDIESVEERLEDMPPVDELEPDVVIPADEVDDDGEVDVTDL